MILSVKLSSHTIGDSMEGQLKYDLPMGPRQGRLGLTFLRKRTFKQRPRE